MRKRNLSLISALWIGLFMVLLVGATHSFGEEPSKKLPFLKPAPIMQQPVQKQEYTIGGWEFYQAAKAYGFNCGFANVSPNSDCSFREANCTTSNCMNFSVRSRSTNGSKCDARIFTGKRLQNGFVIKRYAASIVKREDAAADVNLTSGPTTGSTSIQFSVHGWAEAHGIFQQNWAAWSLKSITLEGPAGKDWHDALR